jgi:hypothetical protein
LESAAVATVVALEEREERWTDEVLEAASERLRFGWTQGVTATTVSGEQQSTPDADSAAFCLLGALTAAARALGADSYTRQRAERSIAEAIGADRRNTRAIAKWNDDPGRSKAEVIALVERALARRVCLAREQPEEREATAIAV